MAMETVARYVKESPKQWQEKRPNLETLVVLSMQEPYIFSAHFHGWIAKTKVSQFSEKLANSSATLWARPL
jgi:hypothetical protein